MNSLSFYIDKFIYTSKDEELDLSFIPSNIRRRLNTFDRHVLYLLNHSLEDGTENIVLASRYGEFDRLVKLIAQYKEDNEVSPMMFSASVHNYPLGQLSILKKRTIPTVSTAAGEETFISGLITAITSGHNNVIYCYADDAEEGIFGMSFCIKTAGKEKYILKEEKFKDSNICINDLVKLFDKKCFSIKCSGFIIERADR